VFGSGDWEKRLQECVNGDNSKVEALGQSVADTIKRYAPIAQVMATFHHQFRSATHSTTYPHLKLEELMADIDES
jgi:predicted dinucleotide-binding enzyme